MNHTFSSLRTAASIAAGAILLAACSAGTSIPTSSTATSPVPVLAASRNSICVTPATSAQTVTLPATAGVTAAVSLGAFDGSASGCDRFTLATGSEADTVALDENARSTSTLQRTAQAVPPRPLLSLTAGETSAGATFGFATIINGVTLTTSPDVQFPDGEYPANLITTLGGETFPQRLTFIARGGVLTLTGLGQPLILHAGTTLYVYPRGTVPPATVSPSPSPLSSTAPPSSPGPIVTPTPRPNETPIAGITRYGVPPAPDGSVIGTYTAAFAGSTCSHDPNPCGSGPNTPLTQGGDFQGQARMYIPSGFFGTISYTLNDLSNPYVRFLSNCPASWQITQAIDGGTIIIPAGAPYSGNGNGDPANGGCSLSQNTLPPGASGIYYTQSIILQPTFS